MSLDRLQSKQGIFAITPEVSYTVASSLSSVGSNQFPGGVQIGDRAGFAPGARSDAGGALFLTPYPGGTVISTMATGGTLSHNGAGFVAFSASVTANNLQLQPPSYAGQVLIIHNVGATTCSLGTLGTVPAYNITTASTQTAQVMTPAVSVATGAKIGFYASPHLASTTGQWPVGIWTPISSIV